MTAQRGATPIIAIQRGATPILFIQRGATQVWALGGADDDFERPDGPLGENWTDLHTSADNILQIEDGRCRMNIPEGTIGGFWDFRLSWFRWNKSPLPSDNGYVECRLATKGDGASLTGASGFATDVWARGDNTADGIPTNGCGIHTKGGRLAIYKRAAGHDTAVDCGSFQSGDTVRFTFNGNAGVMLNNGAVVGTADLTGVVANAANRSLLIKSEGCKDFLGPRRYGPALDYVKMG